MEPEPMESDRPLGRGLEDISRVFLSQPGETSGRLARPLPREESGSSTVLLRPAAQVTREQVAAALREFEGALEEGLQCIDSEVSCGPCGEIDLLAVDRASRLTIVDFDTCPTDELLVRGLGHVDWVAGNAPNLRRMFRGVAINFSLPPRLFLLAPQFSARVRCAARQITGLQISWIRYQVVETPDRAGILFEPLAADA
jgi:hypothetical protein